jgi:Uma2 family endonuclease
MTRVATQRAAARRTTKLRTIAPRLERTNGWETLADLLHDLGDVAPRRVRFHPAPGTAREKDLIRLQEHQDRLCELVDGVLVEKIMGAPESCLTSVLDRRLGNYLDENDRGYLMVTDGPTRLRKGLVLMPDVSFVSWSRVPAREYPSTPIADVVPNLAVEVLSEGNRPREMTRKRNEFFRAGVELVWEIDPFKRTVAVYTSSDAFTLLHEQDTLDGGSVLPGFKLPLRQLFARLPKALRSARKKRKK